MKNHPPLMDAILLTTCGRHVDEREQWPAKIGVSNLWMAVYNRFVNIV
jgi:hypothetical protein